MQISPGTTRFFSSIYLPHLSRMIPCSYWALACAAVLPSRVTSYVVSVRQARGLPVVSLFPHPASFRFHLAMDTLAFGYILPTTGRIKDFHLLETCAAGRTQKKPRAASGCSTGLCVYFLILFSVFLPLLILTLTFSYFVIFGFREGGTQQFEFIPTLCNLPLLA